MDYVIRHHGIEGQKWGKRRFQYEDGSLTPEGRERYGVGDDDEDAENGAYKTEDTNSSSSPNSWTDADWNEYYRQEELARKKKTRRMIAGAALLAVGAVCTVNAIRSGKANVAANATKTASEVAKNTAKNAKNVKNAKVATDAVKKAKEVTKGPAVKNVAKTVSEATNKVTNGSTVKTAANTAKMDVSNSIKKINEEYAARMKRSQTIVNKVNSNNAKRASELENILKKTSSTAPSASAQKNATKTLKRAQKVIDKANKSSIKAEKELIKGQEKVVKDSEKYLKRKIKYAIKGYKDSQKSMSHPASKKAQKAYIAATKKKLKSENTVKKVIARNLGKSESEIDVSKLTMSDINKLLYGI